MNLDLAELAPAAVIASLAALAHETRLELFRRLVRMGETGQSAGELAAGLAIPPQTLSFHLKEMTRADLLRARREGRFIFYSVDFGHARRLIGYLTDSCRTEEASPTEKGAQRGPSPTSSSRTSSRS